MQVYRPFFSVTLGMVHQVVSELMTTLQQLQTRCAEGSQKIEQVTSRVNEIAGESVNARKRLEGLERRVGIEGQQHEVEMRELRTGQDQHAADLTVLIHNASEYQADLQARDHETFEMKELIFNMGVDMEEIRRSSRRLERCPEGNT